MRIRNFIFIIGIFFLFSGCGIGTKSYKEFEKQQDFITKDTSIANSNSSIEFYSKYYIKESYSDSLFIYIRNNYNRKVSQKCVYGHLTRKDDSKQRIIGWVILSGKEYCEQQQQWILSF
jgi:hypothetical protein